jgi:hypothetical protein
MVSRVEGLLHFEKINYQGGVDYMHWYHIVEGDVILVLLLRGILYVSKIDVVLILFI